MTTKWIAVLCVAALSMVGCSARGVTPVAPTSLRLTSGVVVNGTLSDFQRQLAILKGKPTVVNFWASWCPPCKAETPILVAAAKANQGSVEFLGVDGRDDLESGNAFMKAFNVPYPTIGDPDGKIMASEKVVGLPVTKFYRADGKLAFVSSGELSQSTLDGHIAELLRVS